MIIPVFALETKAGFFTVKEENNSVILEKILEKIVKESWKS
ncbi:MAG: hypothetical protein QXJ07_02250 [Candidatus Bathyarchaeia archaeon]